MKIVFDKKCWQYSFPGHPESPRRVQLAYEYLRNKGYEFISPRQFPEEVILNVHTPSHLQRVKTENFCEPDTPAIKEIYSYARLAVEGALTACEIAQEEEFAFSLLRPPGHHAGRDFLGGFCYFNNIAIAVSSLLKTGKRVAILDIDAHHGNGTEDIFRGEKNIIYVSLHQVPLYPGTGLKSQENCYNFPLPPGTGDEEYLKALDSAVEIIKKFNPQMVGVSLGGDTYREDFLAQLQLSLDCYQEIGKKLSEFHKPVFGVLEGGYTQKLGVILDLILKNFKK